jgi:hypothetical protein
MSFARLTIWCLSKSETSEPLGKEVLMAMSLPKGKRPKLVATVGRGLLVTTTGNPATSNEIVQKEKEAEQSDKNRQ